jgi:hypothetical protein
MRHLYELERTINDELLQIPELDEDGLVQEMAQREFVEKMAVLIHEQHIQPLLNQIERLKRKDGDE